MVPGTGDNFGWLQIGTFGSVWLGQALTAALQNNTTYTLSALVARPLNTAPPGQAFFNYSLQLFAGTTLLYKLNCWRPRRSGVRYQRRNAPRLAFENS
jgi:hypothetical protein